MNLAKGQINKVLGVRQTPNERCQKLKAKLVEQEVAHKNGQTNQEATEKIQKYLEQTKIALTNEDNESERQLYTVALLNTNLYINEPGEVASRAEDAGASTGVLSNSSDNRTADASDAQAAAQPLVKFQDLNKKNLVSHIIFNLHILPFECKKYVSTIVSCLFHKNDQSKIVAYFTDEPKIITHLLNYYSEEAEFSDCLNAGEILRELCKVAELVKIILTNHWEKFIELANLSGFDKLSDALQVFTDILTRHKQVASKFLAETPDRFFHKFNTELIAEECNFVTKKQCIKLLAQILSDKNNYKVMLSYVTNADNLRVIMKLLQDPSPAIAFEAFHVFKIFVANPHLPEQQNLEPIRKILKKNKTQLITFLSDFNGSFNGVDPDQNSEFKTFLEEKQFLIQVLEKMPVPATTVNVVPPVNGASVNRTDLI